MIYHNYNTEDYYKKKLIFIDPLAQNNTLVLIILHFSNSEEIYINNFHSS